MKKFLIFLLLLACLASVTNAGIVYGNEYYKKHLGVFRTASQNDPYRRHLTEVNALLFPQSGDATVWYVNSNVTTEGDGTSWANAFDTLNEGIGACSVGDFVDVAEGHNEAIIAADGIDADVAGITIRGYGSGTRMPTIDYDHADGEFVIGATSVTLYNLRFNASVTIVTHAIDVENAGDFLTIIACEFPDGEAAGTDEFVDTIQVGTTATDFTIIGCNYFSTGTGSNNFIDLSAATIANPTVIDCTVFGAFAEAAVWGGAAVPTNVLVRGNTITNTTSSQFGIEFAGNATGLIADNRVSATVLFEVDPGLCSYWQNMEGDTLPEGVSLNGQLGAFTGPAAGTAQDDNVKASLDILQASQAPSATHPNYFVVTADLTSATWNTAAAHEIAAVTGAVRLTVLAECTDTIITASTNGTIALGLAGNTAAFWAAALLDTWDVTEVAMGVTAGVPTFPVGGGEGQSALTHCMFDVVAMGGIDVGYTIGVNAGTNGVIKFHVWWTPLDSTGAVTAGAGGPF